MITTIRHKFWLAAVLLSSAFGVTYAQEERAEVTFYTNYGNITVQLYNETPLHRDNMLRLVAEKAYDGLFFHRVIKDFMVQAGDPNSRGAERGVLLGDADAAPPVPAEIRFPQLFHKRGALAAARESDDVNPERMSSGSQFYIVWGKQFDDVMIENVQHRLDSVSGGTIKLTDKQIDHYMTFGGTPHLDGSYTVYGEVVKGLQVVYRMQQEDTDENDRPIYDIVIKRAKITKKLKK